MVDFNGLECSADGDCRRTEMANARVKTRCSIGGILRIVLGGSAA